MNNRLRTRLLAAIALLALLLQVQTVFACEMMEYSGPVAECCCGDMADESLAGGGQPECGCCTFDTRISFNAEAQERQPVLPGTQLALELPQLTGPPPSHWPPILAPPAPGQPTHTPSSPAHPGTLTYLATRRLRI